MPALLGGLPLRLALGPTAKRRYAIMAVDVLGYRNLLYRSKPFQHGRPKVLYPLIGRSARDHPAGTPQSQHLWRCDDVCTFQVG